MIPDFNQIVQPEEDERGRKTNDEKPFAIDCQA
jgi:hypothetical protein